MDGLKTKTTNVGLIESNLVSTDKFAPLLDEANQIGKILVSSTKKTQTKIIMNYELQITSSLQTKLVKLLKHFSVFHWQS